MHLSTHSLEKSLQKEINDCISIYLKCICCCNYTEYENATRVILIKIFEHVQPMRKYYPQVRFRVCLRGQQLLVSTIDK